MGKTIQKSKEWYRKHQERAREKQRLRVLNNPDKIKTNNYEYCHKGGKYYEQAYNHKKTGIPYEKKLIRNNHSKEWREYKRIIASDSQIHHQWIPNTSKYSGMALVEKDQHQHGYIDVIQILEGEITLLTEDEIRGGNNHV